MGRRAGDLDVQAGAAPGRAVHRQRAVERRHAIGEPAQARAPAGVGSAYAVVADVNGHQPIAAPDGDGGLLAWAYFATFVSPAT